ncbi:hypothetical protein QF036_003415 [Arthrobacter globiformis]|nr:hypothetical protein [Arthrobacter globiformis]
MWFGALKVAGLSPVADMKDLVLIGARLALIAHAPAKSRNRGEAWPRATPAGAAVQK